MKKGKSGQQIAAENVILVEAWIKERNKRRDWEEYAFNNRINRRVIAEGLDFAKSVCTQNKAVRDLLEDADALWFKSENVEKTAHDAARERAVIQTGRVSSDNSELKKRVADLEIENRQLRRENDAYKRQQTLVESGLAGFRI